MRQKPEQVQYKFELWLKLSPSTKQKLQIRS